jgi:hypothetical protein
MSISSFRVKHPRPRKLSNPYDDFTPEMLRNLLSVQDHKLQFNHYRDLLGPHLPAGTYRESVYFLPGAFRYLISHDADALELITPIIGFTSQNKNALEKDGILEIVRSCIRECFDQWSKQFRVIHFDKDASRKNGWGINYLDIVENSEAVSEAIIDLVRFEQHLDIAEEFVRQLANNQTDPIKAAWFIEYSRRQYAPARRPPENKSIKQLINDKERLRAAAQLARQHIVAQTTSPTYWRDTFKKLRLD